MKKLFKILALGLVILPISGCNFDINPADVVDNFYDKRRIYIAEESVVVNQGEERFVSIETDNLGKGADVKNLTFTSCDNTVAKAKYGTLETEDEDFEGMYISGINQGSTSIVASYKNATASCEVKVIKDVEVPYLHLFNDKVTIECGNEYVVNSEIIYRNQRYSPSEVIYDFAFIEGNDEIVEMYQDDDGNIVINPIDTGSTKVLVSTEFNNLSASSLLDITVVNPGVGIVINNEGFEHTIGNTYFAKLYISNYRDYSKTIDLDIAIYSGDTKTDKTIVLTSDNPEIARVNGYQIEGVSKGQTTIRGTYDDIELVINVFVDKPVISTTLKNRDFEVDDNPSFTLADPSIVSGDIVGIYYQDMDSNVNLFKSYSDNKFTIDDVKMRSFVDDFGENKKIFIETKDIYIDTGLSNVYSKIIKTYDDLCSVGNIAQKYVTNRFDFNGYFILGNNINCTNEFTPVFFDRDTNFKIGGIGECVDTRVGFNGVFDGKGFTIFNYKPVGFGSFITWLTKYGTLKNVGFENASLNINFVNNITYAVAVLICNGQGTVSNVYVNYKNILTGLDITLNRYCSTFCSAGGSVKASSVFINASNASIDGDYDILGKLTNCDGVYALGGTHINGETDFGEEPVINERIFNCTGVYRHFKTVNEMSEHLQTQSTIANWNKQYWSINENGIPTWKSAK